MVVRSLPARAHPGRGKARSLCTAEFAALNRRSLRADVRVVDDFAPFGDLRPDARAKLLGRIGDRGKPQRLQPLLDVCCGNRVVDVGAPALDDVLRRASRAPDAVQLSPPEAGNPPFG